MNNKPLAHMQSFVVHLQAHIEHVEEHDAPLKHSVQGGIDASVPRIVEDKHTDGMDHACIENTHQQDPAGLDAEDAVDEPGLLAVVREAVTEPTLESVDDAERCKGSIALV